LSLFQNDGLLNVLLLSLKNVEGFGKIVSERFIQASKWWFWPL